MKTKTCPNCKGSGLPPERWMDDLEGKKPCKVCGGSGKVAA